MLIYNVLDPCHRHQALWCHPARPLAADVVEPGLRGAVREQFDGLTLRGRRRGLQFLRFRRAQRPTATFLQLCRRHVLVAFHEAKQIRAVTAGKTGPTGRRGDHPAAESGLQLPLRLLSSSLPQNEINRPAGASAAHQAAWQ